MLHHRFAHGERFAGLLAFGLQRGNVGRRRRRRASRFSRTHLPRSTGEVRVAYDVRVRMLPWPSRPPRGLPVGNVYAPELAALDVGDSVVLGQPLIQKGVVRRQQIQHAAILAQDAVQEQLGFALEGRRADRRRSRGTESRSGCFDSDVAQVTATARRSWSPAIRSADRPACAGPAFQNRGVLQLAGGRRVQQLVVRDAAPRKNDRRDASSRSLMR